MWQPWLSGPLLFRTLLVASLAFEPAGTLLLAGFLSHSLSVWASEPPPWPWAAPIGLPPGPAAWTAGPWAAGFWNVVEVLVRAMAFRLGLVGATLVHEWGHLLAAFLVGPSDWLLFSTKNLLGNTDAATWLACLNPFSILPATLSPHVHSAAPSAPCPSATWQAQAYQDRSELLQSAELGQSEPPGSSQVAGRSDAPKLAQLDPSPPAQLNKTTLKALERLGKSEKLEKFEAAPEASAALADSHESLQRTNPVPPTSWRAHIVQLSGWVTSVGLCLAGFWLLLASEPASGPVSEPASDPETWLARLGQSGASFAHVAGRSRPGSQGRRGWRPMGVQEILLGACCSLLGATATDLWGWRPRGGQLAGRHSFFCGNFGLLLVGGASRLRERAVDAMAVLEAMAAVSTQRGGQSGGLVTLVAAREGRVEGVRVRVCPSKRQSLSRLLVRRFQWTCSLARLWGWLASLLPLSLPFPLPFPSSRANSPPSPPPSRTASDEPEIYAGHTRFATSSIPSAEETHPHQWTPERARLVWRVNRSTGLVGARSERVGVYITHNGDFEFWNLFGRDRTHAEMGLWLARVLGRQAPAECDSVMIAGLLELLRTQGLWMASLRLAFQQVVAMSYEEVVAPEPGVPSSAPSERSLLALSEIARNALTLLLGENVKATTATEAGSGGGLRGEVKGSRVATGRKGDPLFRELPGVTPASTDAEEASLRAALSEEKIFELEDSLCSDWRTRGPAALRQVAPPEEGSLLEDLPEGSLQLLARQTVCNFLDNDLFWAVKKFLAHAKGSFGMAASCTLDPDRIVLAALNQPLSVGFAPAHGAVLYSSEAEALKVALARPHKKTKRAGQGESRKAATHGDHIGFRFDLDEAEGEILELRLLREGVAGGRRGGGAEEEALLSVRGRGGGGEEGRSGTPIGGDLESGPDPRSLSFVLPEAPFVELRLHNRRLNCATGPEELKEAGRVISLERNHYVTMLPPAPESDVVGQDIKDIPRVLAEIRAQWASDLSLNRKTAQAMFEMLAEKAAARAEEDSVEATSRREIDVLVIGVESSLWVGEQFAADLQNMLPQLRVVPMSANKVIGVMGNARGAISTAGFSFCRISTALTRSSVVLSISQSGQTFPTLHATRILSKQCPGRVFVCVGMLDSKMAGAVGQTFASDSPFGARVFCTNAGWRSAEPATVSAVAAHATLTELMLLVARQLRVAPGLGSAPLGLRLSMPDILDLQRMRDAFVDRGSVAIVGATADGSAVDSDTHRHLLAQGFQWALHILETPLAWALSSLYIFVTVVLGVPIFTNIRRWIPLTGSGDDVASYVAHALDAWLYCFLPLVFALILRLLTRRELLARIGMRTIVIADIPYVHQLLEVYVSKLFALSYWIASVEVHGANPIDHFVHRFTHRVKRGVLLAVGRPDGRLCSQTKCESWVLMAVLQARSIVSLGVGAEAVTIGHNPHSSNVIKRHIVLPSNRPHFLCEKLLGVEDHEPMKRMASRKHAVQAAGGRSTFGELDSQVVGAHLCLEGTLQRARRQGLLMVAHGRSEIEEGEMEDPHMRSLVLGAMDMDVQRVLESQSHLEELTENRFLSLERLVAFHVMFHKMARTVSSLWPLQFDTDRSQSCLRIATTAAPVSAADLEREWLDGVQDSARDVTVHRRRKSASHGRLTELLGGSRHGAWKSPGASLHGVVGTAGGTTSPGGSINRIMRDGFGFFGFTGARIAGSIDAAKPDASSSPSHQHKRARKPADVQTPGASLRGGMNPGGSQRGGLAGIGFHQLGLPGSNSLPSLAEPSYPPCDQQAAPLIQGSTTEAANGNHGARAELTLESNSSGQADQMAQASQSNASKMAGKIVKFPHVQQAEAEGDDLRVGEENLNLSGRGMTSGAQSTAMIKQAVLSPSPEARVKGVDEMLYMLGGKAELAGMPSDDP